MAFMGSKADVSKETHQLLEPPSPAYSNVTVRRAFVVWMYCGQRNKFKDVCNYYHYLEALEDQLPPESRAQSRHHEFNLFSHQPPVSSYLVDYFPRLYRESCIENYVSKVEQIREEKRVFKLEGIKEREPKGTSVQEIVEASRMIRKYCRIQMISVKKFLEEFKQHASKCDLKYTVNNVEFYIKRKMVQAEIDLEANYANTLGFLNTDADDNIFNDTEKATVIKTENNKVDYSIDKEEGSKAIRILKKDVEMSKNWGSNGIADNNLLTPNTDYIKIPKSTSIDDFTECNVSRKERRFSGSRFMKVELEKFRKI